MSGKCEWYKDIRCTIKMIVSGAKQHEDGCTVIYKVRSQNDMEKITITVSRMEMQVIYNFKFWQKSEIGGFFHSLLLQKGA